MSPRAAYLLMFYALQVAYEEEKTPAVREFLTDANPFLFLDRLSADPSVYDDFSKRFLSEMGEDEVTAEQALSFVREYLLSIDPVVASEFSRIADKNSWNEAAATVAPNHAPDSE